MITKPAINLTVALLIAHCMACQTSPQRQDISKPGTEDFAKLVTQLDEFKQEQKRIDSINKKSAFPITVSIEIIDTSFLMKTRGKISHLLLLRSSILTKRGPCTHGEIRQRQ